MTTKAAEDFDFIAKRLKEIQEEKERARQQQEQQPADLTPANAPEDDDAVLNMFYGNGCYPWSLQDLKLTHNLANTLTDIYLEMAGNLPRPVAMAMDRAAIAEVRKEDRQEWGGYD